MEREHEINYTGLLAATAAPFDETAFKSTKIYNELLEGYALETKDAMLLLKFIYTTVKEKDADQEELLNSFMSNQSQFLSDLMKTDTTLDGKRVRALSKDQRDKINKALSEVVDGGGPKRLKRRKSTRRKKSTRRRKSTRRKSTKRLSRRMR